MNVGQRVRRTDAVAKTTGAARYVDDLSRDGMLYGACVRSPVQRGRILRIEFADDFDWRGITIVRASDIPGENVVKLLIDDQPVLAERELRHLHEPVCLLAAEDPYRLDAAVKKTKVVCEEKTPVHDIDASLAARTKIHGDDNIFKEIHIDKGNVAAVFADSRMTIEETFEVGPQEQLYIEPQGMLAEITDDGVVTVTGSLQCPYYVHRALKAVFGIDDDKKVRVIQAETGGGFGGKEEYPSLIAAHAALLALKSGRPVKMIYDRAEDMAATTKRHPGELVYRGAFAKDGELLAVDIDICLDGGAYCTLSPVVLSRCVLHALSAYRCANVKIRGRVVATHSPPNGAFRGFGAPQSIFACELFLDLAARELGISPIEIRRRNHLLPGDSTTTGQILDVGVSAQEVLEKAAAAADYEKKWNAYRNAPRLPDRPWRGIGLSLFAHGNGFTGSGEKKLAGRATVRLSLRPDLPTGVGAVVLSSSAEIGQGVRTIFAQIAADALGLPLAAIDVLSPDTAEVPDSGPTVASRTCMIVGGLVEKAARSIVKAVRIDPESSFFESLADYIQKHGVAEATETYVSPKNVEWDEDTYRGAAYPAFGWACDIVEVEVDPRTLEAKIVDVVTCQDVGRAIHPLIVEGQIEGGTVQALGYAAFEEVVIQDGAMFNNRLSQYIIPTAVDVPDVRVILHENAYAGGPFGAKGIGEMPIDGGAPAYVAAVCQATGFDFRELPLTPERIAERLVGNVVDTRGGDR